MQRMIDATGDHAVTLAENGEEGLRHLREQNAYDMIVSDIGLPGISGLEMVDQAVQAGLIDFARVVICSANTWLRQEVLARGACCISKPVDRKRIFAAMKSLPKA
ncbi:MAG: response regulator, partial [Polyangiaceae bacterium]